MLSLVFTNAKTTELTELKLNMKTDQKSNSITIPTMFVGAFKRLTITILKVSAIIKLL